MNGNQLSYFWICLAFSEKNRGLNLVLQQLNLHLSNHLETSKIYISYTKVIKNAIHRIFIKLADQIINGALSNFKSIKWKKYIINVFIQSNVLKADISLPIQECKKKKNKAVFRLSSLNFGCHELLSFYFYFGQLVIKGTRILI